MSSKSPVKTGRIGSLADLADPFGVDPVGRYAHEQVNNLVNPQNHGSFTEQVGKSGDPNFQPPPDPNAPPDPANAKLSAFDSLAQSLKRRRAMSTLFSGGQGPSDNQSPSGASLTGA